MTRLFRLLKVLMNLKLKHLYIMLRKSAETFPQVSVSAGAHGVICGFPSDYLFQTALHSGINEPHFVELVDVLLDENCVALDIGANIGTHSMALSKKLTKGRVISFEPQSLTFSILQNNLLLNNCLNVDAFRFAVASVDNQVVVMEPFTYTTEKTNNGVVSVDNNGGCLGDFTLTKRIDSFDFDRLDFIKLDIQGYEIDALNGAQQTIKKFRPVIFVEIEEQHLRKFNKSSKLLIEQILGMEYVLYRIENHYPCDHICIPLERMTHFEEMGLPKLSFQVMKIMGKRVEPVFANDLAQNYLKLSITE